MDSTAPGRAAIRRRTAETEVEVDLRVDGRGKAEIATGVGFLDHMLTLLAVHGFFDLRIAARGDLHVDAHHTVEDVGICLGQAMRQALDGFVGIRRYAHVYVPMDEALARVCVDVSNRPCLRYQVEVSEQKIGDFDVPLAREFLRALSYNAGLCLHVDLLRGENGHHCIEAVFKALGRALDQAFSPDPRLGDRPLSSKGSL